MTETTTPTGGAAVAPQPPASSLLRAVRIAFAAAGVVTAVVGLLILLWPGRTAVVGTAILAVYAVVVGLVYLGLALFTRGRGAWNRIGHGVLGVLYVGAGIAVFGNLRATTAFLAIFLAILIGALWIIEGIVALLSLGASDSKAWTAFFAVVSVIAGVTLISSPLWSAVLLWWLVGVSLVVLGVMQVVRALTVRAAL